MTTARDTHEAVRGRRRAFVAQRAFARASVYRLLSQSLSYPSAETMAAVRAVTAPAVLELEGMLGVEVAVRCGRLADRFAERATEEVQRAYRRVFPHVESGDCPARETAYTAQNISQETDQLSDLAGFLRAFGLQTSGGERPDHISVELEFMYLLAYKEGYALLHHGGEKARLCRTIQRKFMQDHLGRWAPRFAELLAGNGGDSYLRDAAELMRAFLRDELARVRARPEPVVGRPVAKAPDPDAFVCPLAQEIAAEEGGDGGG